MFCRYDLWGKPVKTTRTDADKYNITERNPIRYRSYYYDTETGLYYLNARYYDPNTRRFLNADSLAFMGGGDAVSYNLYAYCLNNPVNMADPDGNIPFMIITAAIGAAAGAAIGGIIAYKTGGNVWAGIGIGAAAGGLIGVGAGAAASSLIAGSATASTGAVLTGTMAGIEAAGTELLDKGFSSYGKLKEYLGSAGSGNAWHHIVEQCQINKSGFTSQMINNVNNIVKLPDGSGTVHAYISALYSSITDYSCGMRVRDWLAGQSFEFQLQFGIQQLEMYGKVIIENGIHVFVPY